MTKIEQLIEEALASTPEAKVIAGVREILGDAFADACSYEVDDQSVCWACFMYEKDMFRLTYRKQYDPLDQFVVFQYVGKKGMFRVPSHQDWHTRRHYILKAIQDFTSSPESPKE